MWSMVFIRNDWYLLLKRKSWNRRNSGYDGWISKISSISSWRFKVNRGKDYTSGEAKNLLDQSVERMNFPSSNVLQFITEDGSVISARPSGTEPKIKFYCSVNSQLVNASDFRRIEGLLEQRIDAILSDLGL